MVKVTGGDQHFTDGRGSGRLDGGQKNVGGWRSKGPKWDKNQKDVSDKAVDEALKAGKNPNRVFAKTISQMSPENRRIAKRRIAARIKKRRQ